MSSSLRPSSRPITTQALVCAAATALLAACSGGGGGTAEATSPVIGAQPQAATVLAGKAATFTVTSPTEPGATFAWQLNGQVLNNGTVASGVCSGAVIAGATSATLTISNAPAPCNQSFVSASVANASGSTFSTAALLTVVDFTRLLVAMPTFANGSVSTSVSSNAPSSASTGWRLGGAPLTDGVIGSGSCAGTTVAGSTTNTISLTTIPAACHGVPLTAQLTLAGETLSSPVAMLLVTEVTRTPVAATLLAGGVSTFAVATAGHPVTYAWRLNGVGIADGPIAAGACAGAVASGTTTAELTLRSVPVGCHGAAVTTALTSVGPAFITPPATVNVAGFGSQPASPAAFVSGTVVTLTATSGGLAMPSTTTWSLDNSVLADGIQAGSPCAGMSVSGASTETLRLTNVPTSCSNAAVTATLTNSLGSVSTRPATLTVTPGDVRNGTYKAFATNGATYELTVDFNSRTYLVSDGASTSFRGSITPDTTAAGLAESGTFRLDAVGTTALGGAVRVLTDGLVGNLQPAPNVDAVSFIGARRFVRAGAEIAAPIDLRVLGREYLATSPDVAESRITTAQISASGLLVCSGNLIVAVANCAASGSTLLNYAATYNADGSVSLVNVADATETSLIHIVRFGTEIAYLRSGVSVSGGKRVRFGIQSSGIAGTTGWGASTDKSWVSAINLGATTMTANGVGAAGMALPRSAVFEGTILGGGLATYRQADGGGYFAARSPNLVVVVGARDFTRPALNGYMLVGAPAP